MNFAQVKGITIPQGAVKQLSQGQTTLWKKSGGVPIGYRRLTGIEFDGQVWYDSGMYLQGSDTLKLAFEASIACNVLGCYTDASAQTNYSLYVSTSSTAKYLRYNGGTYNSAITANTRYDVIITPTGSDGMKVDSTWTAKTFTTPTTMMIGTTSVGATSAKLTGALYGDIEVVGREKLIPVKRMSDGKVGYWMESAGVFLENLGTGTPVPTGYLDNPVYHEWLVFDGTAYIDTTILIPQNGSIRCEMGRETLKATQRVFFAGDPNGYVGMMWGGATTSTKRQILPDYDSASYLVSNYYLEFIYTSAGFFLTPQRVGFGGNNKTFTKGSARPSTPLIIGSIYGHSGQAFTGSMKTFYIYGSDAQGVTSFTGFDSYTPIYTLRPCEFRGQVGLWCEETGEFFGNSAPSGTLSVADQ